LLEVLCYRSGSLNQELEVFLTELYGAAEARATREEPKK
jgi:hypothetical protein